MALGSPHPQEKSLRSLTLPRGDALLESLISPLGMPYVLLMRLIGRSLVGPNCLPVIGQES